MDQTKSRTTAGDFFIYLGIIIGLYVSTFSFISLSFDLINKWLPDIARNYYYFSVESIRMELAALIIFFPAFIYLSRMSSKAVAITPEKKDLWVRHWFFFLTLFFTGLTIAIDLTTLVYNFIGGEDLTMRFISKILVVFLVAFSIFRFYLYEIRRDVTLPTPKRKYLSYAASLVVLVVIILGISVIGSPMKQRDIRFDQQRVSNLSSIQYAVTDYYRANNTLPVNLDLLTQGTSYYVSNIKDPVTKLNYEYNILSENKYEICAKFSTDSTDSDTRADYYNQNDNWKHEAGRVCFKRIAGEIMSPKPLPGV
jgi:hypothetical protein